MNHKKQNAPLPLYARFWSKGVQPFFETYVRGRQTPRIQRQLDSSQWSTTKQLEDQRWNDFSILLKHAQDTVPFYQEWFQSQRIEAADISSRRDLSQLPLISRDMIMAAPEKFQSIPVGPDAIRDTTGGTTGAPLRFLIGQSSYQWRLAVSRRGYEWAGCVLGRRQAHISSMDILPAPFLRRSKRDFHRWIMRQKFINSYALLRPEDYRLAFQEIDRFQPSCIVGYPSTTSELARYMVDNGWKFRRPPDSFLGAGEALFPHQRELIAKAFQCSIFETYGNREFMLLAAECDAHTGLHVTAENVILELIANNRPAAPAELGEIVITDLHNFSHPFIRYRTGDLSSWTGRPCPCGRGAPLLTRIEGRHLDMLRSPNGSTLSGHFIPHFIQNLKSIDRFQVVQDKLDHVFVRIVPRGELTPADRELITNLIEKALPGVKVEVAIVDHIELTKSGKHRTTLSLLT